MNSFLRLWPQIEPLPAPRTGGGEGEKTQRQRKTFTPVDRQRKKRKAVERERMERKKSVQRRPDTHARKVATLTPPRPPLECFSFPASPFCLFCVGRMSSRKGGKGVSGQSDGEEHMMSQSKKKADRGSCFLFFEGTNGGEIEKYVSQFLPLSFSDRLCISPPEPFPRI